MNDPPPMLHELESEIMDVIWDRPNRSATVRQVFQGLSRRGAKDRAYTTLLTVCTRLTEKGVLERTREGQTGIYAATITREAYHRARVAAGVDALLDEAGDLALVYFAQRLGELDPERRAALDRLMSDE